MYGALVAVVARRAVAAPIRRVRLVAVWLDEAAALFRSMTVRPAPALGLEPHLDAATGGIPAARQRPRRQGAAWAIAAGVAAQGGLPGGGDGTAPRQARCGGRSCRGRGHGEQAKGCE